MRSMRDMRSMREIKLRLCVLARGKNNEKNERHEIKLNWPLSGVPCIERSRTISANQLETKSI